MAMAMDAKYEQRIAELHTEHPEWGAAKIAKHLMGDNSPKKSSVAEALKRIKMGLRAEQGPEARELALQQKATTHKAAATKYKKQLGHWQEFSDNVAAMAPRLPVPPKITVGTKRPRIDADMVALLSDAHMNAKWGYDKTDGKTEYDFEIACQLLNYYADEIIATAKADESEFGLHTLHLDILGDILHGRLRVEDEVTNDYPTAPAVLCAAWVLYQFIRKLAFHFYWVRIKGKPGNHSRLTYKPEAGRYIEENMETIMFGIVKALISADGLDNKVSFHIPNSEVTTFERLGHKIKIGHGDHIKGGGGISDIPQYALHREIFRQYKNDMKAGQQDTIKVIEYGHFHDSNLLSNLMFLNGAMCFTGPWALHRFGAYSDPTQWVYYTSKKYAFSRPNPLSLKEGKGRKHPFMYDPEMFLGGKFQQLAKC